MLVGELLYLSREVEMSRRILGVAFFVLLAFRPLSAATAGAGVSRSAPRSLSRRVSSSAWRGGSWRGGVRIYPGWGWYSPWWWWGPYSYYAYYPYSSRAYRYGAGL